jgi:sugar phosphate isomerase/epimerase
LSFHSGEDTITQEREEKMKHRTRRAFIYESSLVATTLAVGCSTPEPEPTSEPEVRKKPLFGISLAQWSLHRTQFGGDPGETVGWDNFVTALHSEDYRETVLAGDMDPITFPEIARGLGIDAVEYVNTFYFDKAEDFTYLGELKKRADSEGVKGVLIMCDAEGDLGASSEEARTAAVTNHHKWVEAASFLGCHAIRVNASSDSSLSPEEQQKLAADGLRQLCEFADSREINVVVENHGGLSSNAQWLAGVMQMVDHPRVGTLPDFANFEIREGEVYDRYQGVTELMPYAKAVSAKSHDFDEAGNETATDYLRMMKIVLDAGYRGYVGIEYEGANLSEPDGIQATKSLLERVRAQLEPEYS